MEKAIVLLVAVVLDAISFIPGVNVVSAIAGFLILGSWSWFRMGRRPFWKKVKRSATLTGGITLIEAVPFISGIFPGWITFVLIRFWKP